MCELDDYDYSLPFDIIRYQGKSLTEQCKLLEIPLLKISMPFSGKPEPAVLDYFRSRGYEGTHCEGKYIFLVIHALILDKLPAYNECIAGSRRLAAATPLKLQVQQLFRYLEITLEEILFTNEIAFKNNVEEILCEKESADTYPEVAVEFAQRVLGHLDRSALCGLAHVLALDADKLFRGWPDLILVNDGEMRFVEVKGKENLSVNQLYTLYHLKRWFDNISVVRVRKKTEAFVQNLSIAL